MKLFGPIRLLVAAVSLAGTAQARDSRLLTRLYDPDTVVRLSARAGVQAAIAIAEDEHIENVAIGDSAAWQITPNKRANLLFVKPLAVRARTNLTIVTDRRSYFIDLVAAPDGDAVYLLRFTYPAPPTPPAPEKLASTVLPTPAASAAEAMTVAPTDPARLNFAWTTKGRAALLPQRVYDDGVSTYLAFAAGKPLPAILSRDSRGAEGPVNYAVRDDVIVIDSVPGTLVLRIGKDAATLSRQARSADTPPLAAKGE